MVSGSPYWATAQEKWLMLVRPLMERLLLFCTIQLVFSLAGGADTAALPVWLVALMVWLLTGDAENPAQKKRASR
jgi:hypothetical protein